MNLMISLERALRVGGLLALVLSLGALLHGRLSAQSAIAAFYQSRAQDSGAVAADMALPAPEAVDFSLWSPKRAAAYKESLTSHSAPAVAVLRIPKIQLEVPVFNGTDELTLNRGLGRIAGTARPGAPGNMGVAGHRDGFFRGLKGVVVGDRIELLTPDQTQEYVVESIRIVTPADVSVLAHTDEPTITLISCYPFYFIGDAPKRWIVRGALRPAHHNDPGVATGTAGSTPSSPH